MDPFGELSPRLFLERHWQQQQLLIREAFAGLEWPLTAEELAGLACEEGVESRLVVERGGSHPWEVRHGPFQEDDFAGLPTENWTLLVQRVDRLLPEVSRMLEPFRFFPNWRLDDVMVSYAAPGGSVGAHVDNYDVFLVQGPGRRRWQVCEQPLAAQDERWLPDLDLRILAQFEPQQEWVLEPGDMLYLPPRLPHHGVALEPCLTFSIGFRAPSDAELVEGVFETMLAAADPDSRFCDPGRKPADEPGRLDADTLVWARDVLRRSLDDDAQLERAFARFISAPGPADIPPAPDDRLTPAALRRQLRDGWQLSRRAVRDWVFIERDPAVAELYVGGEEYLVSLPVARMLTGSRPLDAATLDDLLADESSTALLCRLANSGWVLLER